VNGCAVKRDHEVGVIYFEFNPTFSEANDEIYETLIFDRDLKRV
jgi:hypothetical protein